MSDSKRRSDVMFVAACNAQIMWMWLDHASEIHQLLPKQERDETHAPCLTACRPRKKPGFLTGVTQALDFSQARSKEDAELLYQARYAKQDKMTPEQIS